MKKTWCLFIVFTTLFSLFSCVSQPGASQGRYGIEQGSLRSDYLAMLPDRSEILLTTWLSCYDCYVNGFGDLMVTRWSDNTVTEVDTFDAVEPRSKAELEKQLQTGMDFFEMVKLAGAPQTQFDGTNTLLFPTDGEELLRTNWEKVELADESKEYTLQEFEFYKPDIIEGIHGIYEGMPIDHNFYRAIPEGYEERLYLGYYRCFKSKDGQKFVIIKESDYHAQRQQYISDIFVCDASNPRSVDYLKENLNEGMSFYQVVQMVGFPHVELDRSSRPKIMFALEDNIWMITDWIPQNAELFQFYFLTPVEGPNHATGPIA